MKNKKLILLLLVTFFLLPYAFAQSWNERSHSRESYYDEERVGLKESNPIGYYALSFFNPPILNNLFVHMMALMIGVSSFMFIRAFDGTTKMILILLSLYCWGNVICMVLRMMLVGQGELPYYAM